MNLNVSFPRLSEDIRESPLLDKSQYFHHKERAKEKDQTTEVVIESLGSEIHLNVTTGKHVFVAVVDVQTSVRLHQQIELAIDPDKMHLFEKEPPSFLDKTER